MKRLGLEWWFLLVVLWPALGTLAVGGEALTFYVIRGRWPLPNLDDPGNQAFLVLHPLTGVLIAGLPAIILFMLFLIGRQWRLFSRPGRYQVAVVIFCFGLAAQNLVPLQIWEWFWD